MPLTGRFDFRKSLFGKLVLLVEEDVATYFARLRKRSTKRRWRRANVMDLAAPVMRPLIDLRSKPNFVLQNSGPDHSCRASPGTSLRRGSLGS